MRNIRSYGRVGHSCDLSAGSRRPCKSVLGAEGEVARGRWRTSTWRKWFGERDRTLGMLVLTGVREGTAERKRCSEESAALQIQSRRILFCIEDSSIKSLSGYSCCALDSVSHILQLPCAPYAGSTQCPWAQNQRLCKGPPRKPALPQCIRARESNRRRLQKGRESSLMEARVLMSCRLQGKVSCSSHSRFAVSSCRW